MIDPATFCAEVKPSGKVSTCVALALIASACIFCEAAVADEPAPDHPKAQDLTGMSLEELLHEEITPINVLGSHTHVAGGWMVGYRYMFMDMEHNQSGTRDVSQAEVLSRYPVVHTTMTMEMHMAEVMYAPSDYVTLMAMMPYEENSMHHLTRTGDRPIVHSSGLGDVSFMGLVNLWGDPRAKGQRVLLNAGFSAPTGSINEKEGTSTLEYAMQLGSGTWDMMPGLTYLGESDLWAWGGQVLGTLRIPSNEENYTLGNRYRLSAWTSFKATDWFAPSARLDWHAWEDIQGADPRLDPARNPAFDSSKQSGARLDLLLGLNFYVPGGFFKGNRLSIEGGVPLYQNIAGPNMAVDWLITVGWSFTFH